MAVPGYEHFMLPLLKIASDNNEHSTSEAMAALADQMKISETDRDALLPSGTMTRNASADFTNAYTYDSASRLTLITQTGSSVDSKAVAFSYNALGQYASIGHFNSTTIGTGSTVFTSNYSYDSADQLSSIANITHSSGTLTYSQTYDNAGRVSTFTTADGTSTMSYDATSQLTGVTSGAMPSESFDYDSNGNDTSTGTINANNQLAGDWSYSYSSGYATNASWSDGDGDQVHIAYSYDGSNNVTGVTLTLASGETTPVDSVDIAPAYTYDHEGNVTSVATLNSAGTGTVFLYTYDFRNHLIGAVKQTFTACTMTDSSEIDYDYNAQNQVLIREVADTEYLYYVYDGANIAMTISGSCVVQSTSLTGLMQDQIFAQEIPAFGGTPAAVRWGLIDGQGSVRDVLDNTGSRIDHIVYSVFGDVRSQTDDTNSMSKLYAGYDYDPFIGDYGAYFTGPRVMVGSRFLQQDPIAFSGGQLNLSVYAGNDPVNGEDPSGMRECDDNPKNPAFADLVDVSAILEKHVNEVIQKEWFDAQKAGDDANGFANSGLPHEWWTPRGD